ncbi:AAA family ATPase [uncultured Shewanella sp.]|uniref:AAA family ATPase n=1 Tax=uncultured Shewanella sp. TaxID=173975 RepID=UPI0026164D6E|nr:AAA family ATPase [uncultured Shewanella sp.]
MEIAKSMNNIDVIIKNFGKVQHAEFKVKPFTVIAGKNASGKSYITRSLYTFFSSFNKDHLSIEVDASVFTINRIVSRMYFYSDNPSQKVYDHINFVKDTFSQLEKSVDLIFHQSTLILQLSQKDDLYDDINRVKSACNSLIEVIQTYKKYDDLLQLSKRILLAVNKLEKLMDKPHESLAFGLAKQLEQSLVNNFLVSSVSKLKNRGAKETDNVSFSFGKDIGNVYLKSNSISVDLKEKGVDEFQKIDNVVYLESPVYWKIKDVLGSWVESRNNPFLRRQLKHQQKELKKIPDYILDTFALADSEIVVDEVHDSLALLKSKIIHSIGGHVQISDSGDIQFVEYGESNEQHVIDLHHTATGAVSLGVIALLLEKNVIVPNSVLIFDEPEVNLHPAWQQIMIKVLYELSVAGVRIVFASHSFDMMESIEKLMDSHERKDMDVEEHFSIIQLEAGQTINTTAPVFKKIDAVKADLGKPLFDLFMD